MKIPNDTKENSCTPIRKIFDYEDKDEFINFIRIVKPIYESSDGKHKIDFYGLIEPKDSKFDPWTKVNHDGWECPQGPGADTSMLKNQSSGYIGKSWGLHIHFESNEYNFSSRTYLIVRIIDFNTIEVIYDWQNNAGMKLVLKSQIFDYNDKQKFIDFVNKMKPVYDAQDGKHRFEFVNGSACPIGASCKHIGWKCWESDNDLNNDCGFFQEDFHQNMEGGLIKDEGLIVRFESDGLDMSTFLAVKVINYTTVEVIYDWHKNRGMKLELV
ncbi:MAG: hypothetical protein Satyrvirus16_3 [Satyrvirus sp.]|uniref:Uncharacterized protein n=1 Tax=Satyrvirus sp. TaxID=2487771 RepID=A0A3G5AE28_9VIRU|nr:MAG: hypothetical protein Satyrvirus16_3 [Satyrvirus sp.]